MTRGIVLEGRVRPRTNLLPETLAGILVPTTAVRTLRKALFTQRRELVPRFWGDLAVNSPGLPTDLGSSGFEVSLLRFD
jgi:hypothetical protein